MAELPAFGQTDGWTLLTIACLTGVTVLTRLFFCQTPWSLPHWAQRGLQYAPIAALGAVVIPEVVMSRCAEHLAGARCLRAGAAWLKRGVLGTIVVAWPYLPLRLGLG
jgi:branched-subunit amino acid transport protein